jgi:hypothetical protein
VAFQREVAKEWKKSEAQFDETWFKRMIAKAIIFRRLEKVVPQQPWYEGGYRANIVTYSMAKLAYDMDCRERLVDLDRIWRQQSVPGPVEAALLLAAAEAHHVITHPPEGVRNMSEWAKKQACWAQLQHRELDYQSDLRDYLLTPAEATAAVDEERKKKAVTSGIEAQSTVVSLGAGFWKGALEWGKDRRLVTPKEAGILETCTRIPDRLPSEKQCLIAIEVLERLEADGFEARVAAAGE